MNNSSPAIAMKKSPAWGWSLLSGKHLVIGPITKHLVIDCTEGGENGLEKNYWSKDEGVGVAVAGGSYPV